MDHLQRAEIPAVRSLVRIGWLLECARPELWAEQSPREVRQVCNGMNG